MCWRFYNLINMSSTHAQNDCLPSCTRNPVQGVNLANSCQLIARSWSNQIKQPSLI
jgi:hypothetical protein